MAAQVQLIVQVDDSQLNTLRQKVESVNGTKIKISVDGSGAEAMQGFSDATANAVRQNTLLNNILKNAQWYYISGAVSAVTRSFKDAVATMKEVDAQLTNIQKVSGMTASEIKKIGDAAYDTASKYSVAAEEYLSAVYTFQKAGLGDSAEKLGELATKTMLVGDTTADVASKFLVAVNAAWDLKGSYEELSRVVDEADYINNNYATDLEKLSSGMPIVAKTAESVNMSIEETLAVLGTITAKTQETGTKAATAWRALVMNITGELGTLTDEAGETIEVTAESVKSISDALAIYGNAVVKAAQETGRVIDPMEAVISLAEAYKDGLLTDIELENILMNVGGKLRTNQLTALVKDLASETSTYYDIMAKLPNAAGTADAEIGVMLSSWESKTQILSNTWTEFISHLVDTDAVKGLLDVLTELVKVLDTDFGRAVVTVLTLSAALMALGKAGKSLMGGGLIAGIKALITAIGSATTATEVFTAVWNASPFVIVTVVVAAIYGIAAAVDALTVSFDEQIDKVREAKEEYEFLASEISSLKSKLEENNRLLTEANEAGASDAYVNRLKAENEELQRQIDKQEIAARKAKEKADAEAKAALAYTGYTISLGVGMFGAEEKLPVNIIDYTKHLLELAEAGKDVDDEMIAVMNTLGDLKGQLDRTDAESRELYQTVSELEDAWIGLNGGLTKIEDAAAPGAAAVKALTDALDESVDALDREADAAVYAAMQTEALKLQAALASGQPIDTTASVSALSGLAASSRTTAAALQALIKVFKDVEAMNATMERYTEKASNATGRMAQFYAGKMAQTAQRLGDFDSTNAFQKYYQKYLAEIEAVGGGTSSGGTSRAASVTDAELERLKDAVSLEKQRLSFLEESGAAEEARLAKMRDIQAALHAEAEYLRGIGADEADVLALSTEWWTWQSKIADAAKETAEALEAQVKAQMDALASRTEDVVSIQRKNLSLLKAYGAEDDVILAKLEDIEAALLDQLDYLMAIGAGEEQILSLAGDYLDVRQEAGELRAAMAENSSDLTAAEKEELQRLKDVVTLRKSELTLIKSMGLGSDEQAEKQRQIQDAIRAQGEYMVKIGAGQAEINALAAEWYDIETDVLSLESELSDTMTEAQEARLQYLKDVVSLRENELSLMEARGDSVDDQLAKQRQILEAIAAQGRYMVEIGAAQEDVNAAAVKYYNTLSRIKSLQEEQFDALLDTANAYIDAQEDAAVSALREQLELLQAEHDAIQESREEEEKLLAVEKARLALENAQRQRTVRQYNAASGQWEWVANAKDVASAEEALLKANTDLSEYYAEKEYKAAVAALETQIDYTEEAFDALRESLDYVAKKIKAGELTYREAYAYIGEKMRSVYDEYEVDLTGVMDETVAGMEEVADAIYATQRQFEAARGLVADTVIGFGNVDSQLTQAASGIADAANQTRLAALTFGSVNSDLRTAESALSASVSALGALPSVIQNLLNNISGSAGGGAAAGTEYYDEDGASGGGGWRDAYLEQMRQNALDWWTAGSASEQAALSGANESLGATLGLTKRGGNWYDSGGNLAFSLSQSEIRGAVIGAMKANSAAWHTATGAARTNLENANYVLGTRMGWTRDAAGYWYDGSARVYDGGGVLRGVGGIKATEKDELILPPELTERMLNAQRTPEADRVIRALGIVYGSVPAQSITSFGGTTNSVGTQHNGNNIYINGIQIPGVTEGTTIGELADLAGNLGLYS